MDQAIELLASPGSKDEFARRQIHLRRGQCAEMSLAVWRFKLSITIEHTASILYLVARRAQALDALIGWYDARDLVANGLRVREENFLFLFWIRASGELLENFPFAARLA